MSHGREGDRVPSTSGPTELRDAIVGVFFVRLSGVHAVFFGLFVRLSGFQAVFFVFFGVGVPPRPTPCVRGVAVDTLRHARTVVAAHGPLALDDGPS